MDVVRVAVGVIERDGKVLVAKRPDHVHKGGLWEFPGGKVEPGETVLHALGRELFEELGIIVNSSSAVPLITIRHEYPEKCVELDVWQVSDFSGEPHGKEGQPVRWVGVDELRTLTFPEANLPIITAIILPDSYLITGAMVSVRQGLQTLERALRNYSIGMVRLRVSDDMCVTKEEAAEFVQLCKRYAAISVLSWCPAIEQIEAGVVHFSSSQLWRLADGKDARLKRSFDGVKRRGGLCAASCHSLEELEMAEALGVDFVTLSPVRETLTHPGGQALGWGEFTDLVKHASVPVYALGGLSEEDLAYARQSGAQGVAGIRCWWES